MALKDEKVWLTRFEEYKQFVEEEGRLPATSEKNAEGSNVGYWLRNQNIAYRGGFLTQDRLEMLDSFNPFWKGSRKERQEENKRLFVVSNWKRNVPDGETALPDTLAFEDLYSCLNKGIYSCEKFFEEDVDRLSSFEVKKKVFNAMYPQLDYTCAQLYSVVSGWQFGAPNEPHFQSAEEMQKAFQDVIKTLSPREQGVIVLRFGLSGYTFRGEDVVKPMSLEEVGKAYDLTKERIRQIEAKALRKLRHPKRLDRLFFSEVEIEEQKERAILHATGGHFSDLLIEECNFSVRTFNCLKRAGYDNVGDLLARVDISLENPYEFLGPVRNLGRKNTEEVIRFLESYTKSLQERAHEKKEPAETDRVQDNTDKAIKDALQYSFEKTELPKNWQDRKPSFESLVAKAQARHDAQHDQPVKNAPQKDNDLLI